MSYQRLGGLAFLFLLVAAGSWLALSERSPAPAPEQQPPSSTTRYQLRLGLNISRGSALHAAAERFAEAIGQQSRGLAQVSVHPDQGLGTDHQMVEMARSGELDLILTPTAKLSPLVPAMQYADLPFYFSDREELYRMLDGEPGDLLLAKLGSVDLVGLAFWENGFKHFTANRPIRRPEDFQGTRFRVMKSRIIMEQFKELGAAPVPIDFHATRQALLDGAVDGQENPLVAIVGMGFHEVQSHLTLSDHAWLGYVFSASHKSFASLPHELRELIRRTARKLATWERQETARREARFIEQVRDAGVEVIELSDGQRAAFRQRLAPLARKLANTIGYDLLLKTEELRLQQDLADGSPALYIGLDADLSLGGAQAGAAIYRGMQLAVDEINQQGGLLGKPVKLVARDHAISDHRGRESLHRFAELPELIGVFGGMHSVVVIGEQADIHRLKIPYLVPWAAASRITTPSEQPNYLFRLSLSDAEVAPFLLRNTLQAAGDDGRIAILLEQSPWGRSNQEAIADQLAALPYQRASIHWINRGQDDFKLLLESLHQQGVSSLMLVANFIESSQLIQDMAKLEHPLPVFAHWGLTGGKFWSANRKALQRVDLKFVQSVLLQRGVSAPLDRLIERYRAYYGLAPNQPIPSPAGTLHAYELVGLLAAAVRQAGSRDRMAIRDALESIPAYDGLIRRYQPPFSAEQHDIIGNLPLVMARFDDAGHIVAAD